VLIEVLHWISSYSETLDQPFLDIKEILPAYCHSYDRENEIQQWPKCSESIESGDIPKSGRTPFEQRALVFTVFLKYIVSEGQKAL
jgi:hypothetical protein